jgi:ABC-type uncharacterized transport system substrate-binding protein
MFNKLKRREFITLLGGAAAAWPFAAGAQGERMRRIGVLSSLPGDDPEIVARRAVFEQTLQGFGWTVGPNLRIDYRWTRSERAVLQKFAAELAALAPDVILVSGNLAIEPMLQAARTIPIVFTQAHRSGRVGLRGKHVAARRQRHGLHAVRVQSRRKMAGIAQGDCPACNAGGGSS